MSEVKLGQSPAEFRFEVEWDSGGETGTGVLIVNHYEIQGQMRLKGFVASDDMPVDADFVKLLANAVRETARPKELVTKLTDAQLYAKGNEASHLFTQLGESGGPSQISRRPMEPSPTSTE